MPGPFLRRLLAISCFVLVFSAALAKGAEDDDSKPLIDWNFDEALKSTIQRLASWRSAMTNNGRPRSRTENTW